LSTYTYDETLSTDKDKVRDQLGVTDVTSAQTALVSDEHIIATLAALGSVGAAVVYLARELAARFAQRVGRVTLPSGLSVAWPDRVSTWLTLAETAQITASASVSPASGILTKTAPVTPPCPDGPDANDRLYRGDPYRRRRRS